MTQITLQPVLLDVQCKTLPEEIPVGCHSFPSFVCEEDGKYLKKERKENSEWETQVLYAVPDFKEQEPVSTGIAEGAWREEVLSRS